MLRYPTYITTLKTKRQWMGFVAAWHSGIKDLTDEEIRCGCEWCDNNNEQYPPTIARFRFKSKGLIDPEDAFDIAIQNQLTEDKAILAAKRRVGNYYWRHDSYKDLKRKFRAAYNNICDKVMEGQSITDICPKNCKQDRKNVSDISYSSREISRTNMSDISYTNCKKYLTNGMQIITREYLDDKFPITDEIPEHERLYNKLKRSYFEEKAIAENAEIPSESSIEAIKGIIALNSYHPITNQRKGNRDIAMAHISKIRDILQKVNISKAAL